MECFVAGQCDTNENGCPTTTVTYDYNSNVVLPQHHHPLTSFSESFQHPPATESAKRKSPSIFSSVEELARGSGATQAAVLMLSSPELVSTAHCSPLTFDRSTDSGYGDSDLRNVTSGFDCTSDVVSIATDDVITTPLKIDDFRPTTLKPIVTAVPVLRHQSTSASGVDTAAADTSRTRMSEKSPHPIGEFSAMLAVGMETASSSQLPQQSQNNALLIQSRYGIENRQQVRSERLQLTDGRNCPENEEKLDVIHGGFGIKNPLLTRSADTNNNLQLGSKNFGKIQSLLCDSAVI